MNIRKLIAIVAAIAINCAVLAWFHAWSSAAVASAAAASARMPTIVTLPAITVHPSAAQLRALREARTQPRKPEQASAVVGAACMAMPYYSFAAQPSDCTAG